MERKAKDKNPNSPIFIRAALQIKGSLEMLFLSWDAEIPESIFVKWEGPCQMQHSQK